MNRRFVPFFYNRSGMGEGGDPKAAAFTKGKTANPYAFMAAFTADGKIVGETELYADKDAVFRWLCRLLEDHPDYARSTVAEQEILKLAKSKSDDHAAALAAAELHEELGNYEVASAAYAKVADQAGAAERAKARTALLRITRYGKRWDEHAKHETALAELVEADKSLEPFRFDVAAERGYRLVARDEFAAARELLQPLTKEARQSSRLAELHFTCGVACWFSRQRDWAKFHWCWITEHLPDDRLHRRAYISAAAEAMPYPNYELRNYKADVGNIGTHSIVRGFDRAMSVYAQLKPAYDAGVFDHSTAPKGLRQFR